MHTAKKHKVRKEANMEFRIDDAKGSGSEVSSVGL
jgi:hypothetical protein